MKYLAILFILFPLLVLAAQPTVSPNPNPNATGYATKNCDNKCTKDQQCALSIDDERYYCNNSKGYSDKTPRPLEVYVSCKTIGGVFKGKCSSNEITVSAISGKTEIPIREHKPGQCCIAKSQLKVY